MAIPIDLRSLEAFYWVARLGGFGRAADKLHTTQPAISGRIAALEAEYGVRLLERSRRRGVALTPIGTELLAKAERMLALAGEVAALLGKPAQLGGAVRLGVSETIVHTWLAALLQRLHAEHPRITLDISVDVSPRLRDLLVAGELDVALLLGPVSAPQVTNLPLGDVALAWAARVDLAVGEEPLDRAALARWPILTYARTTRPYRQIAEIFAPEPGARIFANGSLSSIVRMALDGIGICAVPASVIARELAEGRLRLLDAAPVLAPLTFVACHIGGTGNALAEAVATMAQEVAFSSAALIKTDP